MCTTMLAILILLTSWTSAKSQTGSFRRSDGMTMQTFDAGRTWATKYEVPIHAFYVDELGARFESFDSGNSWSKVAVGESPNPPEASVRVADKTLIIECDPSNSVWVRMFDLRGREVLETRPLFEVETRIEFNETGAFIAVVQSSASVRSFLVICGK